MISDHIEHEYAVMEEKTLRLWESERGVGGPEPLPYDERLLAFATGQKFQPEGHLLTLHDELLAIGATDRSLRVIARENMHLTLLALSPHRYTGRNDYPTELELLMDLYTQHIGQLRFKLSSLRLVPLHNTLLLAGIPNEESLMARQQLAEALLHGPWSGLIRARYGPYPIPPVIWHTTLVRSICRFLPHTVRGLFFRYREEGFADIDLGQPILAAVSYDWSEVRQILP